MIKSNKHNVGEGAAYIYIHFASSMIAGYVFWIILSQITTTETIGTFSAIISLTDILTSIAIIGIPDAIQRFLGKTFSEHKFGDSQVFIKTSLLFLSLGIFASGLLLVSVDWFYKSARLDPTLIPLVLFALGPSAIYILLNAIVIASLKTKVLPIVVVVSSIAKITLSIILLLTGSGVLGLTLGYIVFGNSFASILLGIVVVRFLRSMDTKKSEKKISFVYASKNVLIAGASSWIPTLVATIGYQLGTIVLFGAQGSFEAGIYFITLTIVNGIALGMSSLFVIALPVLSSMHEGRKRFTWETIRLSSLVSLPLSTSLIFYSRDVLQLLGQNYVEGTWSLQILLMSIFPTVIMYGVDTLVYSYGNYRQSLAINLSMNVPRIILYFIFVPLYGVTGAAISYTLGSLIALIFSSVVARKIGLVLIWKDLVLVLIIPILVGFTIYILQVYYIIGIIATIIISYLALLKLGVLTRSDINDFLLILPHGFSYSMIRILKRIEKILKDPFH